MRKTHVHTKASSHGAGIRAAWRQDGFSLIEVLVSLIVLSVGLLGLAALQGQSQRATYSAYLRSQATMAAYGLVDRLRANLAAAQADNYDLTPAGASCSGTGPTAVCNLLRDWQDSLANLPGATGRAIYDRASQVLTVSVQWNDTRAGGGDGEAIVVNTQL